MARTPDTERGHAFRTWFRGLPRTTRRIVGVVFLIGLLTLWYAFLLVIQRAGGNDDVSWAEPLPSMVGAMVGGGFVLWLRRRRMGSLERVWEFDRAARQGRLPDDADPAEWEPLLEGAHRFQRRARSFALGLTVLSGVAVVIGMAWLGLSWIGSLVAALVAVAAVAVLEVSSRRHSSRIDRLREQARSLPNRAPLTPRG